jgi:dTDP-4-amino-4,6-dideoxygalactose transaminase
MVAPINQNIPLKSDPRFEVQQHQQTVGSHNKDGNGPDNVNTSVDLRNIRYPACRIRMPLYPLISGFSCKSAIRSFFYSKSNILSNLICSAFGTSAQQVLLAESGTAAIVYWMEWLRLQNGGRLSVALPSFFCEETALAIRDQGVHIVLLELSEDLQLSHASIDFAIQHRCNVLIWPNYFGYRLREQNVLKRAQENSMLVVFDEAHTFPAAEPCSYESPQEITLFSFGVNKPLAGIGGGGMYFPDPVMASQINHFIESKRASRRSASTVILEDIKNVIHTRLRWISPQFAALIGSKRIASSVPRISDAPFPALNHYHSEVAAARWRLRRETMPAHSEHVAMLQAEVLKLWNPLSVSMLSPTCDVPTMFTVRVPSRFRYSLSEALRQQGIQTTWYFYPLHRLTSFQDCLSEPMPVSDRLASELMILPCQWAHTMLRLKINPQHLLPQLANIS